MSTQKGRIGGDIEKKTEQGGREITGILDRSRERETEWDSQVSEKWRRKLYH